MPNARTTAMQKVASNIFTDEERGELHALGLLNRGQSKTAAAPQGPQIVLLPEIFKEAMGLSVEEIKAQMKKVAASVGARPAQGVLKMASHAVNQYQQKVASEVELGDRLGTYMFGGFLKAAESHFNTQQQEQESDDLKGRAPHLAAAMAGA